MNECMNEYMYEWMNERMNKWMNILPFTGYVAMTSTFALLDLCLIPHLFQEVPRIGQELDKHMRNSSKVG